MEKIKFVISLIFLIVFFIVLSGYVIAQSTEEQQPTKEQLEAFQSAKTVRIVVETNITFLPFEDVSRGLLERAGLKVVQFLRNMKVVKKDGDHYDVTLKIEAEGAALGDMYKPPSGGSSKYHYSGAVLSGKVSLLTETDSGYYKNFEGKIKPPALVIKKAFPTVLSAPYKEAFETSGSFVSTVIDFMGEVYGSACLIASLKEADELVRIYAIQSLGKLKDTLAAEPLIEALRDNDPRVRSSAARSLGKIKDLRAFEPLIAARSDSDSKVKEAVLWAVGELDNSRVFDLLLAALNDKDRNVRDEAARALGKSDDPRAIGVLLAGLKNDDVNIRLRSVYGLGGSKDPRAIEALIGALGDKKKLVRGNAAFQLKRITGQDFGKKQKKWQKWWEENKGKFPLKK